jgi:hypothetical protein
MANVITPFLERLTAASGEFNQSVVGNLGFIDSVYRDLKPEVARRGQVIRIPFPDLGAFTDQAGNDWTTTDVTPSFVDITFGQRPGYAILARDWESMQTQTDIIEQFIVPLYQRAQEYANGQIAGLITTGNFNAYSAITAKTMSSISVDDAASAWDILTSAKVPIINPSNAALLYHNHIHRNMLTDTAWGQESLIGINIAQATREQAALAGSGSVAFNFTRKADQQAPTGLTGTLTGTVTVANGSAAVVGVTSAFTTQAPVGSWVQFGTDTVSYRVQAVADDTHLTLTQPYGGSLTGGLSYKRVTYTAIAMHKYAICLALRPLELINDSHITSRLIMLKGIPVRVMYSYVHQKAAWMLTADYAMVAAVMRPSFGVVITA